MRFKLQGVLPALLTPFTKGGVSVDLDCAAALATRLADQGVHGLFVAGTTGEGLLLTLDERKRLLETVIAAVGKRVAVIAHTGCLDTASTIELTQHAAKADAKAAGVITPGFYSYDDDALKRHYVTVAKSVPKLPIFLYNLPGCAKNVLSSSLIVSLAEKVDNICGLKDSSGNMTALGEVLGDAPAGFNVINGVDSYVYQALLSGANGSVASTANVFPELFLGIYNNVRKGNLKKAWKFQAVLSRVCGVFQYGAMVARFKEALRMKGFDPGYVRAPQRELTAGEKKSLAKQLDALDLL
ncbi:MAG: dihydrodipicolinate synthase family protein [bacterium]|nr:dihydrodipicolinate synthase family protein [bacterium]